MSIIRSTVEVYGEQACTTLITSKTRNSAPFTTLDIDNLDEGTEYWARAQVRDNANIDSNWSSAYRFYTLPDVSYVVQPQTGDTFISAELEAETTDVGITTYGLECSTSSSFSNPIRETNVDGEITITNLNEHTTYYVRPFLIDEFNREYINTSLTQQLTTNYSTPDVRWTGSPVVGVSTWSNQITVNSTTALSSIVVRYQAAGGAVQTMNLTAQTGPQTVSLTGLAPNTSYTVNVLATNVAGNGQSTIQSFTTSTASVQVNVARAYVYNANNLIDVTVNAVRNDQSVTITGLWIDMYSNDAHSGIPVESLTGGAVSTYTNLLNHADPDDSYFIFGRCNYQIAGDANTYTAWSEPYEVFTYSFLSFGNITTTSTTATIPYSVQGTALSDDIAYSLDNIAWTSIPVSTPSGGTLTVTGLSSNTSYYLRGRCQSPAGWQAYVNTTFATSGSLPTVTVSSITGITPTEATVNLTIS